MTPKTKKKETSRIMKRNRAVFAGLVTVAALAGCGASPAEREADAEFMDRRLDAIFDEEVSYFEASIRYCNALWELGPAAGEGPAAKYVQWCVDDLIPDNLDWDPASLDQNGSITVDNGSTIIEFDDQ